jgi:phosphoglycolate phosphatase
MLLDVGAPPLSFDTIRGFIGNGVPTLVRRVLHASASLPGRTAGAVALPAPLSGHQRTLRPGFSRRVARACRPCARPATGSAASPTSSRPPTAALLEIHGLASWFEVVVAGDTLDQMKPAPAPLLHACLRHARKP